MRTQRSFKPLCSGGNESQQLYICIVQQLKFIRFYTCVRWILFRFPYWVCIPTTAATAGSAVATAILHNKVSSECWSPDGWIHIHTYMHMYWLVLDWIAGGARRLPEKPTTVLPQKQKTMLKTQQVIERRAWATFMWYKSEKRCQSNMKWLREAEEG